MKIVYCLNSVSYCGGTERVTVTKANALAEIPGNDVYIAVTDNYKVHAFKLSPKVHLIDLKVNYYINEAVGIIKGLLDNRPKLHRKLLQALFDEIIPDVVISVGWSEKYFLPSLKYKKKPLLIRELHYTKHYRLIMARTFKQKIIAKLAEFYDFNIKIKGYDYVAVLTHEDKDENWKGNKSVVVMPNPAVECNEVASECENNVAIAVGRLSEQKNFSSMISAWKYVNEQHPLWKLKIFGAGPLNNSLQKQIDMMGLSESVLLMGLTDTVYKQMQNSSMYLLSSNFEGFPLVIIEAMTMGLPVVSYNCPTGPRDIIQNGKNGFLIGMGEEKLMADKICWLIEHSEQRKLMGKNASETSKDYTPTKIAERWMLLFSHKN